MVDPSSLKILVVDDQEFVRTIVRSMLVQLGVTAILEAADGTDAINQVSTHLPDVIICDVQMRPTDGFGFVRMLRDIAHTAKIPVIMLTAHADTATVNKARELEIDDFISKPVLPTTLAQTISQVLTRRASLCSTAL